MSTTRVFIYGSCVSRDAFEHFDPGEFELVQYVARQSAISAYTKPVELVAPPTLDSPFQQRMISGDYASSLRTTIPALDDPDLVLIDLTDERLGVYVLPDGSVVTRSVELVESGAEQFLPAGTHHVPFGTEAHFQYWAAAIDDIASLLRTHQPRAGIAVLDVPWAERSETGEAPPDSFGTDAATMNPLLSAYLDHATTALGAQRITVDPAQVVSSPAHPWGDAPFHYATDVYLEVVRQITATAGPDSPDDSSAGDDPQHEVPLPERRPPHQLTAAADPGPNFFVVGPTFGGSVWLAGQLGRHPDVFIGRSRAASFFDQPRRLDAPGGFEDYVASYPSAAEVPLRGDHTPSYFWYSTGSAFGPPRPDAAANIERLVHSETPVLLVLREPVARAVTTYWHHFTSARYPHTTSVFRTPPRLGIIDQGFYLRAYENWVQRLGADGIHVLIYEEMVEDPQAALLDALAVLGLGEPEPEWLSKAGEPRVGPPDWVQPFRRQSPVPAQELAALFSLYRADVTGIERAIGRALPSWHDEPAILRLEDE